MRISRALIAIGIVSIALSIIIGIMTYNDRGEANANELSRFQQLEKQNAGYKERAAESGISNADQVPILRSGNKNSKNLKPVEEMKGYTPDSELKDGVHYITKETITFEGFINKYTEFDLDPSIAKDRMINVAISRHPKGFQHTRGFVKNAVVTRVFDAETGDYLGCSIRSLDPDGMGITRGSAQ